jgi:hypothetical protein
MAIRAIIIFAFFGLMLSPSPPAWADDGACMQDAVSICGQFIPDRDRVAACLLAHRTQVSLACRNSLAHFRPHTASAY